MRVGIHSLSWIRYAAAQGRLADHASGGAPGKSLSPIILKVCLLQPSLAKIGLVIRIEFLYWSVHNIS
jgi:hypothetical protein